jgi:hypothetical protein
LAVFTSFFATNRSFQLSFPYGVRPGSAAKFAAVTTHPQQTTEIAIWWEFQVLNGLQPAPALEFRS